MLDASVFFWLVFRGFGDPTVLVWLLLPLAILSPHRCCFPVTRGLSAFGLFAHLWRFNSGFGLVSWVFAVGCVGLVSFCYWLCWPCMACVALFVSGYSGLLHSLVDLFLVLCWGLLCPGCSVVFTG